MIMETIMNSENWKIVILIVTENAKCPLSIPGIFLPLLCLITADQHQYHRILTIFDSIVSCTNTFDKLIKVIK